MEKTGARGRKLERRRKNTDFPSIVLALDPRPSMFPCPRLEECDVGHQHKALKELTG